jgi:transcriptional regulator with XRE-family HTH domain
MIGKRLSQYIDSLGLTKKQFCDNNGLDYNNWVNIMADKSPLGAKRLDELKAALPELNVEWLLYGNGSPDIHGVMEPPAEYETSDPVVEMFLKYLGHGKVREALEQIYDQHEKKKKATAK